MTEAGEKRVALVIGNSGYKHASTLMNPANDARAIGAALARLGFSGTKPQLNLDFNGLRRALQAFSAEADGADMAALYFAGHGIEVDGRNFLIPIDARLERARDIEFETVPLDQALGAVDGARKLSLIVLDACRNNPFRARMMGAGGTRSIGQGLRAIEPSGNLLVAYAAKHGTFALDGKGGNSPYVEALLAHIEKPGIEIGQLFREVRDDVLERTGREQEPHLYGSLGRQGIYLKPLPTSLEPNGEPSPPPIPTNGSSMRSAPGASWMQQPLFVAGIGVIGILLVALVVLQLRPNAAQCSSTDWDSAEQRRSLEGFQKFYADCQHTTYGIYAREELEKRDKADWDEARKAGAPEAYRGYLERWQNQKPYRGRYVVDAQAALKTAVSTKPSGMDNAAEKPRQKAEWAATQDDAAFMAAKQEGSKAALTGYLQGYPQGRNVAAARAELARLGFVEVAVGASDEPRWFKAGGGQQDSETFTDCDDCPRMVVIPSGDFLMGSPEDEPERFDYEGPQHKVTIPRTFAVGQTHVARGKFAAFVKATNYKIDKGCYTYSGSEWKNDESRSWQSPGFDQQDNHPVVCVNWIDAVAYVNWLSSATHKSYRLMSEAEAEYVTRGVREAKPQPRYFFGNDEKDLCSYANGADQTGKARFPSWTASSCEDGYVFTAPGGSFKPNAFGIYDVHGNAWSWTQDCWYDSYKDKPDALKANGGALITESCGRRIVRGGSWLDFPRYLRSAGRSRVVPVVRNDFIGFRVARTLTP